jgi:hypothetical protein
MPIYDKPDALIKSGYDKHLNEVATQYKTLKH